jgi:hypothetical protein
MSRRALAYYPLCLVSSLSFSRHCKSTELSSRIRNIKFQSIPMIIPRDVLYRLVSCLGNNQNLIGPNPHCCVRIQKYVPRLTVNMQGFQRRGTYKRKVNSGQKRFSLYYTFPHHNIQNIVFRMKNQILALLVGAFLTGQSTAAVIEHCKGVNLSGDCKTISVANDGRCSACHYSNFSEAVYSPSNR